MKVAKLDENNNIDFSYLINEDSDYGIQQVIKEALTLIKGFDETNTNLGINWKNYFNTRNDSLLIADIQTSIMNIPYILYITNLELEHNNDLLNIKISVVYITDEQLQRETSLNVEING